MFMVDMVKFGGKGVVKTMKSQFHSIEAHNFHIRRYGHCLYCDSGSKPVHKSLIVEGVK